jgi:D-amino-acid dehydrogenase
VSVLVVGGGVVGLNVAWALHRRNVEVTVLDAGTVGRACTDGASGVNGGWITPTLSTPLAGPGVLTEGLRHAAARDSALVIRPTLDGSWLRWLWQFRRASRPATYRRGVAALLRLNQHGADPFDALIDELAAAQHPVDLHRTGLLALALRDGGLAWFDRLFAELGPLGFHGKIEHLDGVEARRRDPAVGAAVTRAAWCVIDRHLDPEALLAAMAARLRECGVGIVEHGQVAAMRRGGNTPDGWTVTATRGGEQHEYRAHRVVVAAGVGTRALLRPLGVNLPIVGGKGYTVDLHDPPRSPRHPLYLCEAKVGITPWPGRTRVSGTFELPGRGHTVAPQRIRALITASRPYLDGAALDDAPGAGWGGGRAGLRPCTPDGLPFIGAVPGHGGLYVAAGHNMLGLTLGPATGDAVAQLVVDRQTPDHLGPFAVARN